MKKKVLFVCIHNSARSQIAEALLQKYGKDQFEVLSAGFEPQEINPYTLRVMQEAGVDMSGQRAKSLNEYIGKLHFGYLITVCSNAEEKCPIFPGMGMRLHWPFEDPAAFEGTDEARLEKFRQVRDQIEAKVSAWLEEVSAQ